MYLYGGKRFEVALLYLAKQQDMGAELVNLTRVFRAYCISALQADRDRQTLDVGHGIAVCLR
ncbi:hypothetical protein DDR56_08545 [Halomonas venusta]|uniref:Uncharacterized protein n=1 Tax=Vreelandella venusta TaxID=44935 RepID=A0ABX2BAZ0_9GAMM|nr:hypothetical protein [Halomonas venusta]